MKNTLAFILFTIPFWSFGQDSAIYVEKCREFRRLLKYECVRLELYPDSTYYFEVVAVDLPLVVEKGKYYVSGDTLELSNAEGEFHRFQIVKNGLICKNHWICNELKKKKIKKANGP